MQCPRCGEENPPKAKFCLECATPLAAKCTECGAELPPRAKFCVECAHPVGAPSAAPTRAPPPAAYTPQHLTERILTSRAALEGERKQVTVLFADLKGSMELLADRDPEEARRILDPVLERMMDAVHRYEGTVNQVMGDGIMALFGAPLAHEDHAVRACYAALRMQESVKLYADEVRRAEGITPQIRVGLNSGEVVVRSIGSDLRMDYSAVGQTTHLAARMEQMAAAGSILLTPETLKLAEGYVPVRSLGPMPVKGLDQPIDVFEILGAAATRTRLQAAAARGLTRFVGRDTELETLRQTLERAGSGHGQLVALVGEPGVGKSRLTWEFTHSHRAQGWLVLESSSVSYGKATSWLPVSDLLRTYCRVESADDPRRIRQKLLGKVLDLDRALEPSLAALLGLLDVPVEDPAWQALDPPHRRQRTLDAVKRLLLRESQEQPLLLAFEDLHWVDAETQALLDSLVESLPTARMLLLVNYRPEYADGWVRKTYYRSLRLDPLPAESADELLGVLLGADASLVPLKGLLVERTEGNPFFLEESVRTLAETGALEGERGAYQPGKPLEQTQVPATVQAVLAARIDRLAPEDKRLLQAAAVVGKDVPDALLAAIADLPEEGLRAGLARLQAAEFLYEAALFPELEYTFKHALTHEVAYGSLLHERRRALHRRIVAAIEARYSGRLVEHVEQLAHHALHGEAWEQAVEYLRQAGAKSTGRSALREARGYYEQAIAAVEHLPATPPRQTLAIDLRFELRNVLLPLLEHPQILQRLQEAEALALAVDDQRRLGRVLMFQCALLWQTGASRRGIDAGLRARAVADALGDFGLQIAADWSLGPAYFFAGDFPMANQVSRRMLDALQGDDQYANFGLPYLPAVQGRGWLATSLAELGEFATAQRVAEEGLRIAEAANHPFSVVGAIYQNAGFYRLQGNLPLAMERFERAIGLSEQRQMVSWSTNARAGLGHTYVLAGRVEQGLALLEAAIPESTRRPTFMPGYWLADAYRLAGRLGEASDWAGRALRMSRENDERGQEAWALRSLGELAAHGRDASSIARPSPDVEDAERYYRGALALATELGMRPLQAHCHLGLGTLYQRSGRRDQAQGELATAVDMYHAMGMTFWLACAEAALTSTR